MRRRSKAARSSFVCALAFGVASGVSGCFGSAREGGVVDECVPYADECEAGSYCQYVDDHSECVAEGAIGRDEECDGARCQRGSICLPADQFSEVPVCQQPCNGDTPCELSRHTCFAAVDDVGRELPFGVCRYVE
jgi:hypothetical protein